MYVIAALMKTCIFCSNRTLCSQQCLQYKKDGVIVESVPALGRQRQLELSEFKASLVYTVNSGPARVTYGKPSSQNKNKQKYWIQVDMKLTCFKIIWNAALWGGGVIKISLAAGFMWSWGGGGSRDKAAQRSVLRRLECATGRSYSTRNQQVSLQELWLPSCLCK